MKITISCVKCGRRLLLPPEVAGRTVQCPSCQGRFVAESPPEHRAETPPAEAPLLVPVEVGPEPDPEPPPVARRRSSPDPVPVERDRPRRRRRRTPRATGSFKGQIVGDSLGKLSGACQLEVFDDG